MRVYAIAFREKRCYGHGEYHDDLVIDWYPIFKNKDDCKEYIKNLGRDGLEKEIVELDLI